MYVQHGHNEAKNKNLLKVRNQEKSIESSVTFSCGSKFRGKMIIFEKFLSTHSSPGSPFESHHQTTHTEQHSQQVHVLGHGVLALFRYIGLVSHYPISSSEVITWGSRDHDAWCKLEVITQKRLNYQLISGMVCWRKCNLRNYENYQFQGFHKFFSSFETAH